MRGMDNKDIVKTARDVVRRGIADGKSSDLLRHNELLHNRVKDIRRLNVPKPVISVRGGDIRNIIQEGRKKAQHNKAHSPFTVHSQPSKNKYFSGYN